MDPTHQLSIIRYGVARLLGEQDGGDAAMSLEVVARETAKAFRELDRWMSMMAGGEPPEQWVPDRSQAMAVEEFEFWKGK